MCQAHSEVDLLSNKIKISSSIFAIFMLIGFLSASTTGLTNLKTAINDMCCQLMQVLPVVSMLMIIGAGVVYAAGQMMGAETRARANTWATAMLLGAVIGILIVVVAPPVLNTLYPDHGIGEAGSGVCECTP
jgi:uncharacterized membrane protein